MKKWIFGGLACLVLVGLVGWRIAQKNSAEASARAGSGPGGGGPGGGGAGGGGARRGGGPPAVRIAIAGPRPIVQAVEAVGSVESPHTVHITPKVSGRLEWLQARVGDEVAPGMVLARIDPSELQSEVLRQEASVAEARSRLAQAQYGQGPTEAGVRGAVRQQQAGLSSAQADLNQAQRNYDALVAAATADVTAADARIRTAESEVRNAQAELGRQQSSLKNARARLARQEALLEKGFVSAQLVEDVRTQTEVQEGAVSVAEGRLAGARSSVDSAKAQRAAANNQLQIVKRKGLADIEASRARVVQARAQLDVASANRAQTPAFQQNLAALRASLGAAQAQLRQARTRLADTVLRSPIKGSVTARGLDPGALATPGTPILTLQFLDWLYVTSSLPLEQSGSVFKGQPAQITFDALPGRTFGGVVTQVNAAADPASRQFGVSVRVENAGRLIKPGMYGRIRLVTRTFTAPVVVPREAVKETPGGQTATVVDKEGTASVREVKVGATDPTGVQILSGVRAGEQVVVLSFQPVADGQKVRTGDPRGGGGGQRGPGGPAGGRPERGGQRQPAQGSRP